MTFIDLPILQNMKGRKQPIYAQRRANGFDDVDVLKTKGELDATIKFG
ncbi:hypothetical protein [Shewanella surugensis]|uniref:Uncharacterized protein n=1 Tax=Shewanella surugensis TaxID=212020 RepID=A0ABT0LDT4_9GAMM|nr:hypothetical protein [Shewanella surugensis]MCL1125485.1 hypothetical protein [Shewanella surugensis]